MCATHSCACLYTNTIIDIDMYIDINIYYILLYAYNTYIGAQDIRAPTWINIFVFVCCV